MVKVGIAGYGNLGRGVEAALAKNKDMELVGIFTRRDPSTLTPKTPGAKAYALSDMASFKDKMDVVILCGGSATDLPVMTPQIARISM